MSTTDASAFEGTNNAFEIGCQILVGQLNSRGKEYPSNALFVQGTERERQSVSERKRQSVSERKRQCVGERKRQSVSERKRQSVSERKRQCVSERAF